VGVVMADTALHLPDFRAAERTFALIVQVAGRAGRYFPDGRVVVQTMRPESPAIRCAIEHDMEGFYAQELSVRQAAGFPPFTRLLRFVFRSKSKERALAAAEAFAKAMEPALPKGAEILGPAECPVARVSGNWRYQLIFRAEEYAAMHALLREYWDGYEGAAGVYVEADPDPVSLL
jgi:primosomal protein N' (replication factor Y) (superfamily II helicase)